MNSPPPHRRYAKRDLLGLPLDLPLAVPSVPIVAPILTNLVHGAATTTSSPPKATTAQPTTTAQGSSPTQSTTPSQPSDPGSGSGTGTGSSGNGSGSSGSGSGSGSSSGSDTGSGANGGGNVGSSPQAPAQSLTASVDASGNTIVIPVPTVVVTNNPAGIPVTELPNVIQNAAAQPTGTATNADGSPASSGQSANAAHGGGSTVSGTIIDGSTATPISGSGSTGSVGSNPSGSSGSGGNEGQSGATSTANHKSVPGAVIGIAVALGVVAALALALFLVRRRNIRKREARRTKWMPVMAQNQPGDRSARSSFATNFDHGLRPISAGGPIPSLPPPVIIATNRNSQDSLDAQFLFVDNVSPSLHTDDSNDATRPPLPSPMSVRPFSPTESYKFPRPPSHISSPPGSIAHHNNSTITLIDVDSPSSPTPIQNLPPLPLPIPATRPISNHATIVKRPFAPSLADEIYIEPGETVQIMDAYDDGWALVMKPNGLKGLAPLACFEDTDESVDIPAFLAAHKRRSSMPQFHQTGLAQ